MSKEKNAKLEICRRNYCDGEEYVLLGKSYQILIQKTEKKHRSSIFESEQQPGKWILLTPSLDTAVVRESMVQWYRYLARKVILERIAVYQPLIGEKIGTVRIKEQKTRWGSCSSKHNLNFNWKCVLAPIEMVDYIVVHELCHLKELNHSPRFWSLVEKILPDYKMRDLWWKEHGKELELDYIIKEKEQKDGAV